MIVETVIFGASLQYNCRILARLCISPEVIHSSALITSYGDLEMIRKLWESITWPDRESIRAELSSNGARHESLLLLNNCQHI
jgi:hypothetical protein